MSTITMAIIGSLIGSGYLLNKQGKETRQEEQVRTRVDPEEVPTDRNIYHSERYYDAWDKEFEFATRNHLKAQDTVNENVVPLYYNEMSSRQEMSPQLKSYVEKRGQRMKEWLSDKKRKSFINEGGSNEMGIDESPMFQPMGFGKEGFKGGIGGGKNEKIRAKEMIEQF